MGIQNFSQFCGIAATWAVPAPDKPIHAQFSDRIVDHSRMRIRSSEFQKNILVRPDGADTQLPVATVVAADHRNLRETLRQLCQIHWRRLRRSVFPVTQSRRAANL